jgi:predicted adenine nucleotide alpha hydrolase (AANH) superfamily ATPase
MADKERLKPEQIENCEHEESGMAPSIYECFEKRVEKQTLLLHSCCGPCCTSVVERLAADFDITIFFYNPNISDEDEYRSRLDSQKKFIDKYNENPDTPYRLSLKVGNYNPEKFLHITKEFAEEPEGGKRCEECYRLRLEKTVETAKIVGYDNFATTLSVSPHKNFEMISCIGKKLAALYGTGFVDRDFKKHGGYLRSVELSKAYGLFRQNYCGCRYSK